MQVLVVTPPPPLFPESRSQKGGGGGGGVTAGQYGTCMNYIAGLGHISKIVRVHIRIYGHLHAPLM